MPLKFKGEDCVLLGTVGAWDGEEATADALNVASKEVLRKAVRQLQKAHRVSGTSQLVWREPSLRSLSLSLPISNCSSA